MKHLVLTLAGCGLCITGALLFTNIIATRIDWGRVSQYGLFHEFGVATPIAVIGILLMIVGVLFIGGALLNALLHGGMDESKSRNK